MSSWLLALMISTAYAHDANEPDAEYYNSLHRPDANPWELQSCCSASHDCYPTESKMENGQYYALMDQKWGLTTPRYVLIPPTKIIKNTPNPTGQATLCAGQTGDEATTVIIYCFNPSDEY